MKKMMVAIIGTVFLATAWGAQAADARRAAAEELLTVSNAKETLEKSFETVKTMIPVQMKKMAQVSGATNVPANVEATTQKMMAMVMEEFSWDKMKEDYISLYADTFTEEEMKGIIDFYKSPAGQVFVRKSPELAKRSAEMSQKVMMRVIPRLQEMAREAGVVPPVGSAVQQASPPPSK
jgi:hypothetical protein